MPPRKRTSSTPRKPAPRTTAAPPADAAAPPVTDYRHDASHRNLPLEIKGQQSAQDQAKHQAAQRWVSAVNHWGRMGTWRFHVCRDPQQLEERLAAIA